MPQEPLSFLLEGVHVATTKRRGRGVFTKTAIAAGTLIELAPVIVMPPTAQPLLDQTLLHDYIFEWGKDSKQCAVALGLVSMYNHSYDANCTYGMFFKKDSIIVTAVKDIPAGEELFINYNGAPDDGKKVWFETK